MSDNNYSLRPFEQDLVVRALFAYINDLSDTLDATSPGWRRRVEVKQEIVNAQVLIDRIEVSDD